MFKTVLVLLLASVLVQGQGPEPAPEPTPEPAPKAPEPTPVPEPAPKAPEPTPEPAPAPTPEHPAPAPHEPSPPAPHAPHAPAPSANRTCPEGVPLFSPGNLNFTFWDRVLAKAVTPNATIDNVLLNSFDYTSLRNNSDYTAFTCQVENARHIDNFTETEWKAFWINTYNYLAVRVVFENPCAIDLFGQCRPLNSIKEIAEQQPSLFTLVWTLPVLVIKDYNDDQALALNDIEANKLRDPPAHFIVDARIHGCLVCASVSCPDLRTSAYTVDNLDAEMNDNVGKWLNNTAKGSTVSGTAITLSPIFDWYPGDFNNASGRTNSASVKDFLELHAPLLRPALGGQYSISYFVYNWNLNGNIAGLCSALRPCFPWWALLCLILGILVVVVVSVLCVRKRSTGYTAIQ